MSDFQDLNYYELLGVPRSATQDEIKRAYRREMTKYHPDRMVNAPADQQQYAQARAQHLSEAYSALSDFRTRSTYNASLGVTPRSAPTNPPPARDHQAELYDQAVVHLRAGRALQAVGVLRQLQQTNPFYRDSAVLLQQAEAQTEQAHANKPRKARRSFLIVGGVSGLALAGVAAWVFAQRIVPSTPPEQSEAEGVVATPAQTAVPLPTVVLSEPTLAPALAATALPSLVPTEAATIGPTLVPTLAPTALPEGPVAFADDFSEQRWADIRGQGWQVGYNQDRYRIAVDAYVGAIWSYRSVETSNRSIAVDVEVVRGEGGLLLGFVNETQYLSFSINPQQTSYRLDQRNGETNTVLAGGQTDVIETDQQAINRIQARLGETTIDLIINGQQVAQTPRNDLAASARLGLIGISGASAAEIYFDNLEVRELE